MRSAGTREPRKHRWVARTIAMLIRAFTYPYTREYGLSHFWARRADSLLRSAAASFSIRPSYDTTKGAKWRLRSRQASIEVFALGERGKAVGG